MISNLADESLPGNGQMSELGQSRHFDGAPLTSGLPPTPDMPLHRASLALIAIRTLCTRILPQHSGNPHRKWLRLQDEAFDRSKEEFAKHFKTKYPGEDPPSDQTDVAKTFGINVEFIAENGGEASFRMKKSEQ